jgi:hypothetical protein
MGFKRFGKLAGKTNASAALTENSAPNTTTPYEAQPGGTKFLAWGEGSSSLAFNRALGALQENIEQTYGIFDAPALAETRITAGDTVSGTQTFGTRALFAVANGAASINLATLSNTGHADIAPIYWVYTGLHQGQLKKFIRAYRFTSTSINAPISAFEDFNPSVSLDARTANMVAPDDILPKAAGTSIFIDPVTATYQGYATSSVVSQQTLAQFIPPIKYIISDLQPYGGASVTDTVSQWWNDGASLSGYTWRKLYLRPGCFAHVTGAGVNNGLYRIAEVRNLYATASDKAILTRGGLHKVRVNSAAAFTAGRLMAWAPSPSGGIDPPTTAILNNFAYVVFVDTADNAIYLADLPGEEDFGTYGGAVQWGQKVDNTGTVPSSADNIGTVGQVDSETGAGSSLKLLPGQFIFDAGDTTKKATVVAVIQSNAPVQFDTAVAGSITPCNPLGFTLNPTLTFPAGSIEKGNYLIQCKRLSTVREKLNTPGSTAQYKIIPNASDTLNYSEFEAGLVRAFTRYIKTGEESASTRGAGSYESPSGPFTATNMVLGDGLWKVRFSTVGPTLESVATLGAIQLVTPAPQSAYTYCNLQSVSTNTAVISDVSPLWSDSQLVGYSQLPIQIGSTLTVGLNTFTVDQLIHVPYLRDASNVSRLPSHGLDAAYHTHYSASKGNRGNARGSFIRLSPYAPVKLLLPTRAPGTDIGGVLTSNNVAISSVATNNLSQTILEQITYGAGLLPPTTYASIGVASTYSGSMLFKDTNILAGNFPALVSGIPLTNALKYTLNPPYGGFLDTSILGAITEQSGTFLAARGASGGDGRVGAELIRAPYLEVPAGTSVTFGTPIAGANVTVTSYGVGYYNGYYYEIPTQTLAIPNGFSQLVWDGSFSLGSQYRIITGEASVSQATVAFIYRSAPNNTFYNTALITQYKNKKESVITVGGTGSMFTTLADAVDAIYGLTTLGVGNATRTHIIEVRGGTTETRTITFRSGNILIRGVPGRQLSAVNETLASITWSGNRACFDFNGNSHIAVRDLYLRYDSGGLGSSSSQTRVAFKNSTSATCTNITLDNVNIRSVNAGRLHGYFNLCGSGGTVGTEYLFIQNCHWSDATDYGIVVSGNSIKVVNNVISGVGLLTQGGNVFPQQIVGGVLVTDELSVGASSSAVFVSNNSIDGWLGYGVKTKAADKVWIKDNTIKNLTSGDAQIFVPAGSPSSARSYGVLLLATTFYNIVGNVIDTIITVSSGATPVQSSYGINDVGGSKGNIRDNNIYNPGATSFTGITTSGGTSYLIIDGNQTGGWGTSIAGGPHSLGATNRDDP